MRGLLASLVLAACLGEACAQGGQILQGGQVQGGKVDRVDIVETGIYRVETTSIEPEPGTVARQRHVVSETRLVASTTRIEAKVGVHFGMRYRVSGQPAGANVTLTAVTLYPAPGLKNPKAGGTQARGEHPITATIGQINYRGYVFEYDWELVPGAWTFELWDGKRRLASQTFEVVKP